MKAYRSIVSFLTDREPNTLHVHNLVKEAMESLGLLCHIETAEVMDEFEDWQAHDIHEQHGWLPDDAGDYADMKYDQRGDRP